MTQEDLHLIREVLKDVTREVTFVLRERVLEAICVLDQYRD